MKNIFLLVFIISTSTSLLAQQGEVVLGAYSDISNTEWVMWSLTPTVGIFVTDDFVIGTGFNIQTLSDEPQEDYNITSSSTVISPFVRYYLSDVFLSAGVGIGSSSYKTEDTNPDPNQTIEDISSSFSFTLGAGYSLRWGDHLCFEPSFSFMSSSGSVTYKQSGVDDVKTNAPSVVGFGLGLGISVRLGN